MELIKKIYDEMQERNILTAIILYDVISTLLFILNPFFIVISGDFDMIFGCFVGILFVQKKIKQNQKPLNISLAVGIFGGLITTVSLSIIAQINTPPGTGYNFISKFLIFLFMSQFIGLSIGFSIGLIIKYKEKQTTQIEQFRK